MSGLQIRGAVESDLDSLQQLQRGSGSSTAQWRNDVYLAYITGSCAGGAIRRCLFVAESEGGQAVGFIAGRIVGDSAELENIVVASANLRHGIGQQLLRRFIEAVQGRNALRIHLEVRASNTAAVALYKKCGFQQDGLRKAYYSNPTEDALLFSLSLKNSS